MKTQILHRESDQELSSPSIQALDGRFAPLLALGLLGMEHRAVRTPDVSTEAGEQLHGGFHVLIK